VGDQSTNFNLKIKFFIHSICHLYVIFVYTSNIVQLVDVAIKVQLGIIIVHYSCSLNQLKVNHGGCILL